MTDKSWPAFDFAPESLARASILKRSDKPKPANPRYPALRKLLRETPSQHRKASPIMSSMAETPFGKGSRGRIQGCKIKDSNRMQENGEIPKRLKLWILES